ncbi:SUMF1/EgtB/PvdO family nonheme iron enzyme [Maribellus comscasis]|uniref:SUMF1/EgtB/PvdO family nonheme iron enzyme n=1 Tax=Maribellus comscasis TaxID=2681766 RepID=A0A6I6K2Y1_9BACT|nr:SUMF1/EgtB/PvdO family nonheme iron enzyme [Maribellus comscasis]QGY46877.1 SUMF1/EgtB/PvdO family nonheme iron enzyme [Maribellus comscasis]
MLEKFRDYLYKRLLLVILVGFVLGIAAFVFSHKVVKATSTNESCEMCHVHPHVTESWKLSVHYDTRVGIKISCVDCHLPPKGRKFLKEKIKASAKDLYGYIFKDSTEFNWDAKSTLEQAQHFVFKESCVNCHQNLFPLTLIKEGQEAHLYYSQNEEELRCINCHLYVGHYNPNALHGKNVDFGSVGNENMEKFTEAAVVTSLEDFTETIPGTAVELTMKAIPGGSFIIGSPDGEQFRKADEGPQKQINISPFFMAEVELTWDAYLAFCSATAAEGRTTDTEGRRTEKDVDAISGPTPPYMQPDQNWGVGSRPAITMSYHSSETFCKWLSQVTGKTYRLPTEAEWEYAARGGTETPFFFEGDPKDFGGQGFIRKLFGKGSEVINAYVVYDKNSGLRSAEPGGVKFNPFGLKNMLGNVAEYTADWYTEDAYTKLKNGETDPKGPVSGEEHVIRGGSFKSSIGEVRSAARAHTESVAWMKTDPQMPKSIWWLSDCNFVGFRVVCEYDENTGNKSTTSEIPEIK